MCIEALDGPGFHRATVTAIAQWAGISQNGLMHHFPTKADLLIGLLQERAHPEAQMITVSAASK